MKIKAILNEQDPTVKQLYPIIIRISWGKKRKLYYTGFYSSLEAWDKQKCRVTKGPDKALINGTLDALLSKGLSRIAEYRITGQPFNPAHLFQKINPYNVVDAIKEKQTHYYNKRQFSVYRKMKVFIEEITACFGADCVFTDLDVKKLDEFLIGKENNPNTRIRKMKFYRALYKEAITQKKAEEPNPFVGYKIAAQRTRKEKLKPAEIELLESLELSGRKNDVRNLFLFSYYCKGMRFENCVSVKKEAIKDGRIFFQIVKGHRPLSVKIHSKLQGIISQYKDQVSPYVLPFLKRELEGLAHIKQIQSCNVLVNRYLKEIAADAGIEKNVSIHISRHSFATNMKKSGATIQEIKDSLGHTRTSTTEDYLESLDDENLDSRMDDFYK